MKRILLAVLAAFLSTLALADTKISALPVGAALTGVEPVPAVQSGATVQTTPAAINTYVNAHLTGNTSGNAATATAFDHTPTACGANTFALSIAASGNLTCTAVPTTAVSGVLGATNGGTASAFTAFSGPAASIKTFTLPNASANILTDNALVTAAQGGTGNGFTAFSGPATSTKTFTLPNASATILTDNALVTAAQGGTANGFTAFSGPAASTKTFTLPNASATILTDASLITAAQGGTANGFTAFTGPTTSTKTFTLPNASATILTTNAVVSVSQGGTGNSTFTAHGVLVAQGVSTFNAVSPMAADTLLQGQGVGADPAASTALTTCGDSTHALNYSTSTHNFGCQLISAGGGGVTVTQAFKATNTARNNTTTPTLDPDLQFTSIPAGNHTMDCYLNISSGAAAIGFRAGFTTTATVSSGSYGFAKSDPGGTPSNTGPQSWNVTVGDGGSPASNDTAIWNLRGGVITSTSGTFGLSWAQTSNSGTNLTLNQGSYCNLT